jgi:hypothetical protein
LDKPSIFFLIGITAGILKRNIKNFMATASKASAGGTKQRKGDTSRTSSQGQKLSSGGRKETDNKGRPTSGIIQPKDGKAIKRGGRKM